VRPKCDEGVRRLHAQTDSSLPENVQTVTCVRVCLSLLCRSLVRSRYVLTILFEYSNTVSVASALVSSRFDNLHHHCDSTTIRLRYDDTTTHSTTTEIN